jgi:uncharacterized membrane protein
LRYTLTDHTFDLRGVSSPMKPKPKQTNPLVIAVIGLMLFVFGVVDVLFVNRLIGIILICAGVYLGVTGIQRYKTIKSQQQQQKKGY